MGERQHTQRADGVRKKGLRPVEGIDVAAAVVGAGPAARLHGAGNLGRQFVKVPFPRVLANASLVHQAQEISVGADVVEAVIVYADMGDVCRHHLDGFALADFEKRLVTSGVVVQEGRAVLKALGPFGPSLGRVAPLDRKDRRAVLRFPARFNVPNLRAGERPEALKIRE